MGHENKKGAMEGEQDEEILDMQEEKLQKTRCLSQDLGALNKHWWVNAKYKKE